MKITKVNGPVPDSFSVDFDEDEMAAINAGANDDGFAEFKKALEGVDMDDPTALLQVFNKMMRGEK